MTSILRYAEFAEYSRKASMLKERRYGIRTNPCEMYSVDEFRMRFRFSKPAFEHILELVRDVLEHESKRNNAVSAELQLLIALRFFATGSFQMTLADVFGIHQTTVSRIVYRVSRAIAALRRTYIKFPNQEERAKQNNEYHKIAKFPGVIGCIDGTHIELLHQPSTQHSELYRNRKDYFSLNVQVMFDAEYRIRDIVSRWYGSAHDSRIFHSSRLMDKLERLPRGSWILGDSGYACYPFLITPFLNPANRAQRKFNRSQKVTRSTVERGIGCWKRRFPCVKNGLGINIKRLSQCHCCNSCVA